MREIGIDVFEYENFEPDKIETLFLSRGVIGINKVGYITDVV